MVHAAVVRGFTFNVDFSCDLVVWTNGGYLPDPTNDPACRLYSTVQTNSWNTRFNISFCRDRTVCRHVGTQQTQITLDANATRLAKPAASPLETRFPTALALWAQDATT